ncbi:hypothetical protein AZ16_1920 [Bordetella bronchiseptica B18-5 (C3)]|nr:hypothetical protein AZ16_1920 [Bordetella bronchiseptica B18-5 (C3)]
MNTSSQSTKPPPPGGPRLFRKSLLIKAGVAVAGLGAAGALALGLALALAWPSLPELHAMTDYRPRVPLRVYTADGVLIGEFGERGFEILRQGTGVSLWIGLLG